MDNKLNNNHKKDSGSVTLIIKSELENTVLAAAAVKGLCTLASCTEREINRVELCLVEAVNNSIEHAYHYEKNHDVRIDVLFAPKDILHMKITDYGSKPQKSLSLSGKKPLHLDPDNAQSWQCSGRGLAIIEKIMDRVEYHSDDKSNSVSMWYQLSQASVPESS